MKNIVNTYVDRFLHEKKARTRFICVLVALAAVVTVVVFWRLHYTGIAMTNEVYCGLEEHTHTDDCYEQVLVCGYEKGDPVYDADGNLVEESHVHTDDCYESQLTCGLEEHTHTIDCMIDDTADVETQADWEKTLPDKLDGTIAENVVAVAQSQVGYTESEHNFRLDEDGETRNGYTRYGAWYGNEYGEWNAMFAAFCLNYAGLTDDIYPENSGVASWIISLKKDDMYEAADDYTPSVGDLIFLDTDADKKADVVDIIEDIETKTDETIGEDVITKIYTVEGDFEDAVSELVYILDTDSDNWAVEKAQVKADNGKWANVSSDTLKVEKLHVVGYGVLPEEDEDAVAVASVGSEGDSDVAANSSYEDGILSGDAGFSYEDENMSLLVTVTGSVEIPDDAAIDEADKINAEAEDADAVTEDDAETAEIEDAADIAEAADENDSVEAGAEDANAEEAADEDAVASDADDAEISWADITMDVTELAEDSDSYTLMQDYAEEENEDSLVDLITVGLHFYYGDAELDMSDCEVAVEVTPTEDVVESVLSAEDESDEEDADSETEATLTMLEVADDEVTELDTVTVTSEDSEMPVMTASLNGDDEFGIMLLNLRDPQFTVLYYATLPIVQTSDESTTDSLSILDTETTHKSSENYNMYNYGDDAWSLPVNRGTAATNYNTEYLQLTQQGTDNAYKVATEDTFTKIYESNIDDLDGYPDLYAINKLKENDDYTLTTIYVWQGEEGDTVPDIESKDDMSKENGWTEYLYKKEQDYIFTKDESSTGTGSNGSTINYIHVDDYTVIVLDYDVVTVSFSTTADFFDYNITDGYLYTDETHSTTGRTTSNGDYPSSRKYVNTVGQGINTYSSNNGSSHYAFGNMNTGTGYQYQYLGSLAISSLNFINKYNGYQSSATGDIDESYVVGGFSGASFGLATDSSGAGISYNSALTMPTNDLFSESSSENNAKKYLGRSTVTFTQTGDTYTLKSVSGTADTTKADAENMTGTSISINNLDTFIHPTGYGKTSAYTIFTNSFWPLDSLRYNYMDPVFGAYTIDSTGSNVNVVYDEGSGGVGTSSEWHYYDGMPASDDGINHNSYFGMTFSIDFTLTDDYCGPLDYYFFGDDDMWVYLTKVDENGNATGTSELVLDIGGVHSSIGEHVNLWNHIQHTATTATTSGIAETASTDNTESQAGTYRLTFYYTERGASGSSCYMWFTLPSVSASTVENNAGSLRVEKNVEGIEDSEEEFTFTLSMVDGDGQAVSALDYSAAVYNADGTIAKRNERQSDGSVTNNIFDVSGKTFTLTDGQYLIIWNLPVGTVCEVTESDPDGTIQYKTSYTVTQTPDEIVGQEQSGTGRNVTDVGIEDGETAYVVFTNIVSNELPNAGSIGTRPFTIAGMLIIAIGGTGLVYMKKRKKGGAIH